MPKLLITLGDPAGIGPEVIDAALARASLPPGLEVEILGDRRAGTPGVPNRQSAAAALAALNEAVRRLKTGEAGAVVTGPVSKQNLREVGFPFPGQTEFFADAFGVANFGMLLTGSTLTVALATIHVPLAGVPRLLTIDGIVRIGLLTAAFLQRRLGRLPRIAVAGLNPHAGEGGAFGNEESLVIAPAIESLNRTGTGTYTGPAVPDAVFRDAARGSHDGVIAMYHDQGLIPLKLLDFDSAVNVTLGLPIARTSPDHGTAFAIAGKHTADHSSMLAAIELAARFA